MGDLLKFLMNFHLLLLENLNLILHFHHLLSENIEVALHFRVLLSESLDLLFFKTNVFFQPVDLAGEV